MLSQHMNVIYDIIMNMWNSESYPVVSLMQRLWMPDSFGNKPNLLIPVEGALAFLQKVQSAPSLTFVTNAAKLMSGNFDFWNVLLTPKPVILGSKMSAQAGDNEFSAPEWFKKLGTFNCSRHSIAFDNKSADKFIVNYGDPTTWIGTYF